MPDIIRSRLLGFTDSHDRLWKVEVDESEEALTDYNWEITGFTPNLQNLLEIGRYVRYGGNAYYLIPELQKRGFIVTECDDRDAAGRTA